MNYINKIAFHQNIRNEEPNKALSAELAATDNAEGIKEIAQYLYDKNKSISSDCIAVLYTIGYTKPELIQDYLDDFLALIQSKINRMVWGGMIGLSNIASLKADEMFEHIDLILDTIRKGTLITEVSGIITLVNLALAKEEYKARLFPILFKYLEECRPIDFAKRAEVMLPIIDKTEEKEIIENILRMKNPELSEAQRKKLYTVVNRFNKQTSNQNLRISYSKKLMLSRH